MSIDQRTDTEIVNQFLAGFAFFKHTAKQPQLRVPSVNPVLDKTVTLVGTRETGSLELVTTRISVQNNSVNIYVGNPINSLRNGSFVHEGAECAYAFARRQKALPVSRFAGEFVGDSAVSELVRTPISYPLEVYGNVFHISDTPSLDAAIQYAVLKDIPQAMINGLQAARGLSHSQVMQALTEKYKESREPFATFARFAEAGDLISSFSLGRVDQSLRNPFLWTLAEASYPADSTLKELLTTFNGMKDSLVQRYRKQ